MNKQVLYTSDTNDNTSLLPRFLLLLWHLDLQTEVDMLYRLMHAAGTEDVNFIDGPLLQIGFRNVPTAFEQELPLAIPLLFQLASDAYELIPLDVVEHDYIGTCVDGFVCLCLRANFHLEKQTETADFTSGLYRSGDGS